MPSRPLRTGAGTRHVGSVASAGPRSHEAKQGDVPVLLGAAVASDPTASESWLTLLED
ncbi:MAG: hypothetical protein KBB39_03130 [Phycicoccus sp.]|nr:hypothetical protein [Phycicoccus sp.]